MTRNDRRPPRLFTAIALWAVYVLAMATQPIHSAFADSRSGRVQTSAALPWSVVPKTAYDVGGQKNQNGTAVVWFKLRGSFAKNASSLKMRFVSNTWSICPERHSRGAFHDTIIVHYVGKTHPWSYRKSDMYFDATRPDGWFGTASLYRITPTETQVEIRLGKSGC